MKSVDTEIKSVETKSVYFRDMLHTVDESGKRRWIFPKRPKGKFNNYRGIVAVLLLGLFIAGPFLRLHGEPFFLFNVLERRFIIFGQVFWPQDFHLLVLSIITLIVFIILFTVTYGRVFCGWACPQTIFMEFVFRQIEYLIEGNYIKQKRLDRQDWDLEKIWKKGLKHFIFISMAFFIANILLAYIIGTERLGLFIGDGPLAHSSSFLALLIFSGVFYFIVAFFREQVCILICPYGRLQGVLLDEKSVLVAYDYKRGEPRATFNPQENRAEASKGDCIDCKSCIAVCPTGIDIRNGTQLECIHCAACIDACNSIMKRVKLPRGLIRYDSERGISTGNKKIYSTRSIAYSVVLGLLLVIISSLFITRSEVEVTILRIPGTLYQEYGPDNYSNIYKIQLVNKTRKDMPIDLKIASQTGEIIFIGEHISAVQSKVTEATFMVILPRNHLLSSNTPIIIGVFSDSALITAYNTNFLGPNSLDYK